jgi:MerR family transcriptional regulator, light-induced transcriptional regulator
VTPSGTTYEPKPVSDERSPWPALRIGELSRRVGVSAGTIRAWERRYALLEPRRTDGGYRLYTAEDEARIRELTRLRDQGIATAEAARLAREYPHLEGETGHGTVTAGQAAPSQAGARVAGRAAPCDEGAGASAPAPSRVPVDAEAVNRLAAALEAFDERRAGALLDEAIAERSLTAFLEGLVLPLLREVGDRWRRSETSTAQEHFASSLIRARLLGLGRRWGSGRGPLAMLACPSGERHDLGLVSFGLLLHEQGWRIAFFGQDTPAVSLADTADSLAPQAVVISAVDSRRFRDSVDDLAGIARDWDLFVGGAGASRRFANRIGATLLEGEPSYGVSSLQARVSYAV